MMTRRQLGFQKSGAGLGDTPSDTAQPDQLDQAGLLALQGGAAGPNLNPGIDLSASTVAQDVAGGVPFNVQLAAMLGTSGSQANGIITAAAIGAAVLLGLAVISGGRGRRR